MNFENKKNNLYDDKEFINWKKRWRERLMIDKKNPEDFLELMRKNNPLIIPRNYKVEEALEAAEQNNLKPIKKILNVLSKPYDLQTEIVDYQYPPIPDEKYQTFCGT